MMAKSGPCPEPILAAGSPGPAVSRADSPPLFPFLRVAVGDALNDPAEYPTRAVVVVNDDHAYALSERGVKPVGTCPCDPTLATPRQPIQARVSRAALTPSLPSAGRPSQHNNRSLRDLLRLFALRGIRLYGSHTSIPSRHSRTISRGFLSPWHSKPTATGAQALPLPSTCAYPACASSIASSQPLPPSLRARMKILPR